MARIRSIKPEFPQSESMGRISRDARLTFIQCWTLADDEGRLRGNSRMLASLLFPYDDDAPALIDGWLVELERESCIVRYQAGGQSYIQIHNWLNHQKIDHASKSKIPAFDESSRIVAKPREASSEDQGLDQGSKEGKDPLVAGKPTTEICPQKEIIALYAEALPELPQPRVWEGAREKNLTARWRWVLSDLKAKGKPYDRDAGLHFFHRMFGYIHASDFLMGRTDNGWNADLGWIVKSENFAKIIQGNYENKEKAA